MTPADRATQALAALLADCPEADQVETLQELQRATQLALARLYRERGEQIPGHCPSPWIWGQESER